MVTSQTDIKSLLGGNLSSLALLLVRHQLLDENTALEAIEQARRDDAPLITYLVEKKFVQAMDVARVVSREFNFPLLDIRAVDMELAPIQAIKEELIRRYHALPLHKRGNRLFVALSDPTNQRALEDTKFQSGLTIEPIVVVETHLAKIIEQELDKSRADMLGEELGDIDVSAVVDEAPEVGATDAEGGDDAPVVRFVNRALLDAINRGASDIHFEPYEKTYRVRYRQDGILSEVVRPPVAIATRIAARLKVMSQLDIAERRVPQDGRIKLNISKQRAIDFRVSTMPTLFGEKVVLRILDPSSAKLGIDALGYDPHQKELFMQAIKKPQGMVLVTGPTGSGKTVSLYTALNILNTAEVNISTAEDPVEINLPGINQVNVNIKTGMTFANALRAFLRQDPDIIMVGEIRDLETAEIAIKAAQTGHMVLSTLHTNSAPETLTRLLNMGVEAFNVASSVTLIIAQRLARRLCLQCKAECRAGNEPGDIPHAELLRQGFQEQELGDLIIYRPVGCEQCTNGYKGRVGVYEVMPVSEEMGRLMMAATPDSLKLAQQARDQGVKSLRESGLDKVREGMTSLEEINRVTKD